MNEELKSLEKYLSSFNFNSREPFYNDDSDYTTNAPSYYDDLARKNKLIKHLALRIWDYDKEMVKRLEQWDKNLEEFPDEIEKLLREWIDDGTFAEIINEEVFQLINNKIDMKHTNVFNIEEFESFVVDGDWTPAIHHAIDTLPIDGGVIEIPINITIKSPVIIDKPIIMRGLGYTSLYDQDRITTISKLGNFNGITTTHDNVILDNFTLKAIETVQCPIVSGDGINIESSRVTVSNVSAMNHGGNGFRVGNEDGANCNLWRLNNIYALANNGDGVFIHDGVPGRRDTNAGIINSYDARRNKGNGLNIGNTSDNSFVGVSCQLNEGFGILFSHGTRGNYVFNPYVEANAKETGKPAHLHEIYLEEGTSRNAIYGQNSIPQYDSITNDGNINNYIQTYDLSQAANYINSILAIKLLSISDKDVPGNWRFESKSSGLELGLFGTGSSRNFKIFHPNEEQVITTSVQRLRVGDGSSTENVRGIKRFLRTIHIPDLQPGGSLKHTHPIPGLKTGDTVILTPRFEINENISYNVYPKKDIIVIIYHNTGDVTLPAGSYPWYLTVLEHSELEFTE